VDSTVADLMRRNLLDVFNEQDPERRNAAIAVTYAVDVVWHEPDRVNRGRDALAERAAELLAQAPDWVMRPDGPISVNDDLGHLAFQYGPAGQPPVVTGWTSPIARTASSCSCTPSSTAAANRPSLLRPTSGARVLQPQIKPRCRDDSGIDSKRAC